MKLCQFKLALVYSEVVKTCLIYKFTEDKFEDNFTSTIGIDFKIKTIEIDDKIVRLQIWDTAGQEKFRSITTAYYRGANGIILVYDITKETTFNSVNHWIQSIKTSAV